MDNLRLVLLIIGCLIILGIYCWEVLFKSGSRKNSNILDGVDEFPDLSEPAEITIPSIQKETTRGHVAIADLGNLLTRPRNEEGQTDRSLQTLISGKEKVEAATDLPLKMNLTGYEESNADSEDYDIFIAVQEDIKQPEANAVIADVPEEKQGFTELEENQTVFENNKNSQDILVLYISGPGNILFNGLSISKVADEVGMIYGQMNIFHHFGPDKLHSAQALFSMANMYEPGSFESGKMADLETKGIALFMYLPASIDASIVFELFLNTTKRIAALLGGEIRTVENKLLNSKEITKLRARTECLQLKNKFLNDIYP